VLVGISFGNRGLGTEMELFVSPKGSDSNPGTRARPLRTLEAARDAARKRKDGKRVTVWLRGGLYERARTFKLGKPDSGTKDAPIVYRACKGEHARLIGGVSIPASAFKAVTDKAVLKRLAPSARKHVLRVELPALGITDFGEAAVPGRQPELFFNDRPMPLARWPNEGFARIAGVLGTKPYVSHGLKGDKVGKLLYKGDRPKRWVAEKDHMRLHGYWFWDWADSYEKVKSIDVDKRVIATAPPYHHYGYRKGLRFYALNLLAELDSPGEWFLDRVSGILYFWPPGPIGKAAVTISLLAEPLVEMKNSSHVILQGLTLEATRGAAVEISGGRENLVAGCTIRNTGTHAVSINGGTNNGVAGCDIYATGSYGISLSGGNRRTLTAAGNYAVNNHIHHFARLQRTYAGAVHLSGVGNRAAHNCIHHAPHLAVLFKGNENVIEFNRLHDICHETGDVGVFYTGRDWTVRGNVIRYNFVHHVRGPGLGGAQVVYLDDAASGTVVFGNVIYKCERAMLLGGGRDNVIENNVMIACDESVRIDNRGLNWMKAAVNTGGTMRKRLAAIPYKKPPWSTRYPRLARLLQDEPAVPKGNVVRYNVIQGCKPMNLADEVKKFGTISDNLVTEEELGFFDEGKTDFRMKKTSAVFKALRGFKPIPFEKIGLYRDRYRKSVPAG